MAGFLIQTVKEHDMNLYDVNTLLKEVQDMSDLRFFVVSMLIVIWAVAYVLAAYFKSH